MIRQDTIQYNTVQHNTIKYNSWDVGNVLQLLDIFDIWGKNYYVSFEVLVWKFPVMPGKLKDSYVTDTVIPLAVYRHIASS